MLWLVWWLVRYSIGQLPAELPDDTDAFAFAVISSTMAFAKAVASSSDFA
ncbi:hypothetical protein VAE151_560129 [Vibrio aestuarianus]|uniref:Uncharacterized protein n=1 Tax=Vibrio aestuarianus TaxID=28171 RepID=A0ABM9FR47_9VIBR|nr:hypothetical protein VAE308_1050777 [Vibrio aestuarianus]CAH8200722.1 hypothetical protein VIBAE_A31369 [Vibrio aestuarianus subsp. francensis]CAH8201255.1 hypothetical protein VAE055_380129 [Vibrio aestuarianus]CAH8201372.1 hypothetical protein VAE032_270773 [Vibrio aestuarianus]CAH8201489.1 hypothetical protein VAE128_460778 [Vibrio aestuarianus]